AQRVLGSLNLKGVDIEVRTTVFRSFSDVSGIAKSLTGRDCTYVIQQGIPENAPDNEIRKEKALTREELLTLAQSVSFLKDVRIRTKEKGEERAISSRI
ncbi:MAG: anaerobic ribonucleoside-triphosphate reductase activating protein, partial [Candidatus Methanoperedens sp.]|nr:anaerobic ribonucleoside-triphosphate reductase activating protein [Candidatus Methanoperedens sp.]